MVKRPRHIPERTCVGCRSVKAKKDLVRIVKRPTGEVEIDFTGKLAGRGAYICPKIECLEAARHGRRLDRALTVTVQDEMLQALSEKLRKGE